MTAGTRARRIRLAASHELDLLLSENAPAAREEQQVSLAGIDYAAMGFDLGWAERRAAGLVLLARDRGTA